MDVKNVMTFNMGIPSNKINQVSSLRYSLAHKTTRNKCDFLLVIVIEEHLYLASFTHTIFFSIFKCLKKTP